MYYKIVNDRMVFSDCKTIQTNEGLWVSNPSAEQIAAAGWQVYIPPEVIPSPITEPAYEDIVAAVKKMLQSSVVELTDEQALEVAALYPTWTSKIGESVTAGERLWYNDKLYKVLQPHTVQNEWTPDITAALYAEVSIEEFPEWVQPISAETAYNAGDKVSHNGTHWESNVNANTWEPGVYGWTQI